MEMFPRGRYDEGSGTGAEKEIETDGEWAGKENCQPLSDEH
jgi:hypothetical protein